MIIVNNYPYDLDVNLPIYIAEVQKHEVAFRPLDDLHGFERAERVLLATERRNCSIGSAGARIARRDSERPRRRIPLP